MLNTSNFTIDRCLPVAPVLPELFLDRPHLDTPKARRRPPRRDLDGLIQVPGIDQEEPTQLLLGLGEEAVGHRLLAASNPHGAGGLNALECVRDDQVTALPQGLDIGQSLAPEGVPLALGQGVELLLFFVGQAQVLHCMLQVGGQGSGY